ncbi:hypothetical protein ACTOI6_19040 (plasmid) [Komagataeibacter intermedius]|uniref:hypothetical protein n=1 Tax=Komagataeibacter intermedius TaxID=66229 RepID=UPI004036F0B1
MSLKQLTITETRKLLNENEDLRKFLISNDYLTNHEMLTDEVNRLYAPENRVIGSRKLIKALNDYRWLNEILDSYDEQDSILTIKDHNDENYVDASEEEDEFIDESVFDGELENNYDHDDLEEETVAATNTGISPDVKDVIKISCVVAGGILMADIIKSVIRYGRRI